MDKENSLVSIIVRTKDRPKLLKNALRSIAGQTYRPIEVVLVNDGGCDLNVEELKSILGDVSLNHIRLEKNTGRAHAGNVGIENTNGGYIGFLDDDDEFYPEHVAVLASLLNQIDYKVVYADSEMVSKDFDFETKEMIEVEKRTFSSKEFSYEDLLAGNYIPFISVLFTREVFLCVGPFDEIFDLYEDWDLLIRCGHIFPFYHIKKVTSKYVQWSKELQVAQSEKYLTHAKIAYEEIISKHRDKFHPNIPSYSTRELDKTVSETDAYGAALRARIREKNEHIRSLETMIKEKDEHIGNLMAIVREKDKEIERTTATLNNIYNSNGWKALLFYYKMRDWMLPPQSKRKETMKLILDIFLRRFKILTNENVKKAFFYLKHYGVVTFYGKIRTKLFAKKTHLLHKPKVPNLNFPRIGEEEITFFEDAALSVIIPTKNAGSDFEYLLTMLRRQKGIRNLEIIVVDSGSTDETLELARSKGAMIIEIPPERFSHSYARNLGAENASGNYLLFTVQDAIPPSDFWLYELFYALKNGDVVAVSCAESPREDVDLLYRVLSWNHQIFLEIERGDRILSMPDKEDYLSLRKNGQLSDIACLIKKDVFAKYGFKHGYAEDLDLGVRLIRDGYKLALLGSVTIIHSHNRPCYYYLKRWYAENLTMPEIIPDFPILSVKYTDLLCDIVVTYNAVRRIVTDKFPEKSLPCCTEELVEMISSELKSAEVFNLPHVNVAIDDNIYIDEKFRHFLRQIYLEYMSISRCQSYRGVLLHSLASFMETVSIYLKTTYDLVDRNEVEDLKACMYKAFALLCGTHLAYCYRCSDDQTRELIQDMHNDLAKGI